MDESVTLHFPVIPEVFIDFKAKRTLVIVIQTTVPEANKMKLNIICACVTDVFNMGVRTEKTPRGQELEEEEWVGGENRSR